MNGHPVVDVIAVIKTESATAISPLRQSSRSHAPEPQPSVLTLIRAVAFLSITISLE